MLLGPHAASWRPPINSPCCDVVEQRERLTRDQIAFEVRYAAGRVPGSVWVRVRGKDRLRSDAAMEEVVQQITDRLCSFDISRAWDPDTTDFGKMGK